MKAVKFMVWRSTIPCARPSQTLVFIMKRYLNSCKKKKQNHLTCCKANISLLRPVTRILCGKGGGGGGGGQGRVLTRPMWTKLPKLFFNI